MKQRLAGRLVLALGVFGLGLGAVAGGGSASAAPAAKAAPKPVLARRAGIKLIHPPPKNAAPSGNTLTVGTNGTSLVVTPHPLVYLIFWGSQWSSDPAGAQSALTNFFTGLHGAPDNWDTILTQYCEGVPAGTATCGLLGTHIALPTSSILGGTWVDNAAAAPNSATMAQIAAEAVKAATHFGNTTQAPNLNAQYVIVSATGTHPDGFPGSGFCGWHSSTSSASGTLAYTNLPYVPDTGVGGCTTISNPNAVDGLLSTETHEYAETATDVVPGNGWTKASTGDEIGDLCVQLDGRITLSTGTFDVQGIWSNATDSCVTTAPQATPPTVTKSFGAASIVLNGSTTLTLGVSNPNPAAVLTGIGFTDTLPAGLVVGTPNGLTGSCGSGTITAVAGSNTVTLAAAALAGGASCSFVVNVKGTSLGTKANTTSLSIADESLNGAAASASVDVVSPATTTCVVTGVRAGPPKQQDVTVQNTTGLASITNIQISNGTVSVPQFAPGTTAPVVVTATKTNQSQGTSWSFDAVDSSGQTSHCV